MHLHLPLTLRAMDRMSCSDGSLADGRCDKFGRLRWKGLGLVAPANMPTYRDGGTLSPLVAAARPLRRSLSSPSSSTEMAIVRITNCSSASPSGVLTSIFTWSRRGNSNEVMVMR